MGKIYGAGAIGWAANGMGITYGAVGIDWAAGWMGLAYRAMPYIRSIGGWATPIRPVHRSLCLDHRSNQFGPHPRVSWRVGCCVVM